MREPLSGGDIAVLNDLGARLTGAGLPLLLRSYRSIGVRTGVLGFDVALLPDELVVVVGLLCLNRSVARSQAAAALGEAATALLCRWGFFVEQHGAVVSPFFRLIDHFGVLVFVGTPSAANPFYYGEDSVALGSWILGAPGRRSLDICCGVGTQTLLAARYGGSAVGIDNNPDVLRVARVNAALNGLSAAVDFRLGDVLLDDAVLLGDLSEFETIFCNPPLLPVPSDCPFPHVGDGGADALAFPNAILPKLNRLLAPGGRLYLIGTLLGGRDDPDLSKLERIAREHRLDLLLMLLSATGLARGEPMREALELTALLYDSETRSGLADTAMAERWDGVAARGDTLFSFCMLASRAANGAPGWVAASAHYERNSNFWDV